MGDVLETGVRICLSLVSFQCVRKYRAEFWWLLWMAAFGDGLFKGEDDKGSKTCFQNYLLWLILEDSSYNIPLTYLQPLMIC